MKKIVVIGALGYLGTELCRIYSGESWRNKIVAIDSRFVSERVSQLKDWNIEFFQGHILDKDFLNKHLNDADAIHHLAGITDVAYLKTEANTEFDEKIKSIKIWSISQRNPKINKEQTIKLESKLLEVEIERQIKLLKEQIVGINNLLGMRLSGVMSLLKTKKDLDIAIDNYISEGENDGR